MAACVTVGCGLLAASGRLTPDRPGDHGAADRPRRWHVRDLDARCCGSRRTSWLRASGAHLAHKLSNGLDELGGWLWPYRGGGPLGAGGGPAARPGRPARSRMRVLLAVAGDGRDPSRAGTGGAAGDLRDGHRERARAAAGVRRRRAGGPRRGDAACCRSPPGRRPGVHSAGWPCAAPRRSPCSPRCARRARGSTTATPPRPQQAGASFQWDQLYGPDRWPRSQAPMIAVSEQRPALLRVTSLDRFDGLRFLRSAAPPGVRRFDLPHAKLRRWTERASIEIEGLRSSMLASAGGVPTSARWLDDLAPALAWRAGPHSHRRRDAGQGRRRTRSAPMTRARRRATGSARAAHLPARLPPLHAVRAAGRRRDSARPARPRRRGPARAGQPRAWSVPPRPGRTPASDPATAALIEASPYAPMFALARRLAAGAPSSYDVAARVARYLRRNYAYDRRVPLTRYPLEAFLFSQRRGYCQQFSGAMTLMLRMDGVPARVGVGFRPVARAARGDAWSVRASDAHAWVEVFLGGIGWVAFDPTPPAALAGAGVGIDGALALDGVRWASHRRTDAASFPVAQTDTSDHHPAVTRSGRSRCSRSGSAGCSRSHPGAGCAAWPAAGRAQPTPTPRSPNSSGRSSGWGEQSRG